MLIYHIWFEDDKSLLMIRQEFTISKDFELPLNSLITNTNTIIIN
jgi:hypothetical protein